jgi:hypothetical protein
MRVSLKMIAQECFLTMCLHEHGEKVLLGYNRLAQMNMTITYNMEIVNQWLHVCMVAYPLGLERNAFGSKTFLRLNGTSIY